MSKYKDIQEILASEVFTEAVEAVHQDLIKEVMATDWDDPKHRDAMAEHGALVRVLAKLQTRQVSDE